MKADFWNDKRPEGITNSIDIEQFDNLIMLINYLLKKHRSYSAFTGLGQTITFHQLDQYSKSFASYLQNKTSLKIGDRIAIQIPNTLQYVIAAYAIIRSGFVLVNTNPLYTKREMKEQFIDSGVKAIVCIDNFLYLLEGILHKTDIRYIISSQIGDMLQPIKRIFVNFFVKYVKRMIPKYKLQTIPFLKALKQGKKLPYTQPKINSINDPVMLQYTSGTTGKPKGAILTHKNLIANTLQIQSVLLPKVSNSKETLLDPHDIIIAPLPIYHIYAFTVHLLGMPFLGNHSILIANPRDTTRLIKDIKPFKFNGFIALNTLFLNLIKHPKFSTCNFSQLKFTLSGGIALQKDIAQKWYKLTGCQISESYGLTECSPGVCINPIYHLIKLGSVGLPFPSTQIKIIDKNNKELPIETIGELCVKGPQVMKGYWQKDEKTKEVLKDDWLKTGDLAIIKNDGFINIVDRIKDIIIVSGFNVYPNEIENIVSLIDGIENCAAISIPDYNTGEAIKLFVVTHNPTINEERILEHCRTKLTAYKVPKIIEFCDKLPVSPIGKVLKKELKK